MSRMTVVTAGKYPPLRQMLMELWTYRGLIVAFSARDLKVKYFQTVFGPLWVLLTPLITVGVMTFVFGLMVRIPSDDLPYLLFYLVAIVPWYSFIAVLNQTISSLESHAGLINKIYFPRLIIGLSYGVNGAVDFLVGYGVMVIFALYFSLLNFKFFFLMPLLLYIQTSWALGIGLFLSPLNARYRDIKHIVPLLIQLYYFANPIVYPSSVAPPWAQWIYIVNPFAVVINTYRATLNGHAINGWALWGASIVSTMVFLLGAWLFMCKEKEMVDVL